MQFSSRRLFKVVCEKMNLKIFIKYKKSADSDTRCCTIQGHRLQAHRPHPLRWGLIARKGGAGAAGGSARGIADSRRFETRKSRATKGGDVMDEAVGLQVWRHGLAGRLAGAIHSFILSILLLKNSPSGLWGQRGRVRVSERDDASATAAEFLPLNGPASIG